MLKNEWKKLFQNKFMIVVMIAIILIPTIYTAIFVGAMWDPYGRVEHLPVAVVNKDCLLYTSRSSAWNFPIAGVPSVKAVKARRTGEIPKRGKKCILFSG